MNRSITWLGFMLFMLAAGQVAASEHNEDSTGDNGEQGTIGTVYTMSNAASGNEILLFDRDMEGNLTGAGAVSTEGLGTGAGLGNQNGVILDPANRWLFVINAGSDDISVFEILEDDLSLVQRVSSNGEQPISLTYAHNFLYVLNSGGDDGEGGNITGFSVGPEGELSPLPDSTRMLSGDSVDPAQIEFNADGDVLVVTEKATNNIVTYTVDAEGIPGDPNVTPAAGTTPFGFAFGKRDQLFVSEAAGGAQNESAVSSYIVAEDGEVTTVSPSVGTTETAACWVVVTPDGRLAYTTNTGSGSISGYRIAFDGSITLLDDNGRTGTTGPDSSPIDMAMSNDNQNLYTLNAGNSTISVFKLEEDGELENLGTFTGLPVGANGLAAR